MHEHTEAALAAAVMGNVLLLGQNGGVQHLPWLLAMVPAFLLAYHRGWGGVAVAIAMGMDAIVLTNSLLLVLGADVEFDLALGVKPDLVLDSVADLPQLLGF
ncbi:MAG: hypothetical protein EXR92_00440 [Gemmatimonadetes bacterium]|nr:hypothetical protein [Gemmatimonadota bacterium]